MKETIVEILKEMSIDERYYSLCLKHRDVKNRYPLKRKDVESVIRSYDEGFKYVTGDRLFIKEMMYQDYSVRFYIGFRDGIISFFYSIWIEDKKGNGHRGNLHTLSEYVNPDFNDLTSMKAVVATTLDEAYDIIDKIFQMLDEFTDLFKKRFGDIEA